MELLLFESEGNGLEVSNRWRERQDYIISEAHEEFQNGEISQVPRLGTVLPEGWKRILTSILRVTCLLVNFNLSLNWNKH